MARDLGKSSSAGSAARLFPGSRRLPASRSLPGSGGETCRCAERFPRIERATLRAARNLRGNDGERSAIMLQMTENAPRSCSGARTLRDHAAERNSSRSPADPVPQDSSPARPARTAPCHLAGAGPRRRGSRRTGRCRVTRRVDAVADTEERRRQSRITGDRPSLGFAGAGLARGLAPPGQPVPPAAWRSAFDRPGEAGQPADDAPLREHEKGQRGQHGQRGEREDGRGVLRIRRLEGRDA